MKQRVLVQGIVKQDEKTLLLRRVEGRAEFIGKYELPGGRVEEHEQPDEAIVRHLEQDAGLAVQTVQLFDVVSIVEHQDQVQSVFIMYVVGLAGQNQTVRLGHTYDKYTWRKMYELHQDELRDTAQTLLGISEQNKSKEILDIKPTVRDVNKSTGSDHVIMYSDGGSRGNPGDSAAGFVLMNEREEVIDQGGAYLGITTNSQAEYQAVRMALERARELGAKTVEARVDSMMVVNQMRGIYQVRNRELWPVHERIVDLMQQFDKVTFTHVHRESNQLADGLVNKVLDEHRRAR